LQEKLGYREFFKEYQNTGLRGTMYPGVVGWTFEKKDGREQIKMKWKTAM
jgi:hypothetical protein